MDCKHLDTLLSQTSNKSNKLSIEIIYFVFHSFGVPAVYIQTFILFASIE